ncbi:hypothetical protein [Enterococcus phage phiSHEF14]|nr:hypothetical protein [Enterococcus phage phiSHEF14]
MDKIELDLEDSKTISMFVNDGEDQTFIYLTENDIEELIDALEKIKMEFEQMNEQQLKNKIIKYGDKIDRVIRLAEMYMDRLDKLKKELKELEQNT